VRATTIVPTCIKRQLLEERIHEKWHENDPGAFVIQAQDESFYERDTPIQANGGEPSRDSLVITPILEHTASELLALVADNIYRRGTGNVNGTFMEMRYRYGCGIIPEGFNAYHASQVAVDNHCHPPAKRPALR
tara:strand:- start:4423 stop:4824 length:402 start_codon:yes stop_codon:yes gene_type:complete